MSPDKLTTGKIKAFREYLLQEQDYRCDLCGKPLKKEEANLDHSHIVDGGDGNVRGAIHAKCNKLMGSLENNWKAPIPADEIVQWLRDAADYIEKYQKEPTGILHPRERTHLNKLKARNKK